MFSCLQLYVPRSLCNSKHFIQIKKYGRWTHRRPVRVLTSEGHPYMPEGNAEEKYDAEESKNTAIKWRHAVPEKSTKAIRAAENKKPIKYTTNQKTFDMLQTVVDANGDFIYTKLPNKDTRITSILTSIQSASKKEKKSILLEGKRLIKEALQNNCKLEYLLFSRKDEIEYLKPFLPKSGATLYKMPYSEIQLWSDLTTSPGIMGIFKKPSTEDFTLTTDSVPLTVICDNIREPGNLGAILRTCAGVGCQSIMLTKGCVDLWDSKVVRSSCGAHFQLHIQPQLDWPQVEESIHSNSTVFMADNKVLSSAHDCVSDITFRIQSIPLIPYYGIHVDKTQSVVLVVGGETEGLSTEAYKLVYDWKGVRLNIPLTPGIDSLNSSVALGIILFEMKKQMLLNVCESNKIIQNVT